MGYYSHVSGDITFVKPTAPGTLTPRVLEELQGSRVYSSINFFFAVNPDGLTATGESGTTYELTDELRRIVALLRSDGATAHGTVLVEGADRDDVWRVVIDGEEVREERAEVSVKWPSPPTPTATPEPKASFGWLP